MRCPAGANRQGGAGESTFDVRLQSLRVLRGEAEWRLCTIFDVRWTIAELARFARRDGGIGAWRRLCTIFDGRWTIAELARFARRGGGRGAWRRLCTIFDVRWTIAELARFARGRRQTGPAYVQCTMDDGGAWRRLCTIFDVRWTIAELARFARRDGGRGAWRRLCTIFDGRWTIAELARFARRGGGRGAWRRLCTKYDVRCTIAELARFARRGGGRREAAAYVRCTMDDVRLRCSRALRGEAEWRLCTIYGARFGIYEIWGGIWKIGSPAGNAGEPIWKSDAMPGAISTCNWRRTGIARSDRWHWTS